MKHLKTKLMLSAAAFACLGAIAFQPAVAKAEGFDVSGLRMENGASVCLSDEFSGIRWTTTIDAEWYNSLGGANCLFGAIVAPTDSFEGALTHNVEGVSVVDLPVIGGFGAIEKDTTYYSVIDYNDIWENYQAAGGEMSQEEVLEKAYEMELTARAYVQVDGEYYYADMTGITTSRSARQVAFAAELSGEIQEKYRDKGEVEKAEKAASYYGYTAEDGYYVPEVESNGAVGTKYLDLTALESEKQTIKVDVEIDGTVEEVLIGAEKMRSTVAYDADKKLLDFYVLSEQVFSAGETYVTVFTEEGKIYTIPFICATKAIKTVDDLKIFNAKGVNGSKSVKVKETVDGVQHFYREEGYWSADQEQGGYYVLGADIEAEGYVHGSKKTDGTFNDDTWNSASTYKNMPIGLTGTFNGLGYAIKDMEIGSEREGFFGIVNGGTVKNVAFLDVKATGESKFVIANYLYKATVENVYIRTDKYVEGESMGFPTGECSALANYAAGNSKLRSLFIHYQTANDLAFPSGVMFTAYNDGFTTEDVYCVTDNKIGSSYTHALMYINNKEYATGKNYNTTKSVWLAENEISLTASDGTVYMFAPGEIEETLNDNGTPNYVGEAPLNNVDKIIKNGLIPAELALKFHSDTTRARVVMYGAFRYNSLDALYTYNETYTNLANTGCWSLDENNQLVWGK